MKNILVTGATGFIGLELISQLTAKKVSPRVLVRRPLRAPLLTHLPVVITQGDLHAKESLTRACQGIDTIIHLGARAIFEEYHLVKPTIVDGSLNLMHAAIKAGVKRFIYASSLLVYGNQTKPIDQKTPLNPMCGYGRAKKEAEERLSNLAKENNVDFAAIRLPHVYGARDLMFEQIRMRTMYTPGNGNNLFSNLHVFDAARILIGACEKNWQGASAVADNLPIDWNTFFEVVRNYYPRLKVRKIPEWMALLATYCYTPFRRLSESPSIYTPDSVISWNLNLPVKKGLLWEELDLQPKFSTIFEGIPSVLDECVPYQWIHPVLDREG